MERKREADEDRGSGRRREGEGNIIFIEIDGGI